MLLECMEIYGCLFECKIEEIFKHYTDEIEAVQHAKDIEEAYVKIIETGITKAQPHVITIEKLKTKIEQLLQNYKYLIMLLTIKRIWNVWGTQYEFATRM